MAQMVTITPADWQRLWQALQVAPPEERYFVALQEYYTAPERAYHTLTHIAECLAHLAAVTPLAEHAAALQAAIWFHDVIYDPRRHDNEAASAAWAATVLQSVGVSTATIGTIQQFIEDTAHRHPPRSPDGALLVDIDLTILGAPSNRFAQYETQIRHEYAWVPWPTYCQRRADLLQQFLERPTIYQTALFQDRFEDQARRNLKRSIHRLYREA
ncbi:MAG: hypothetical protein KDE58_04875 [Caldilineaceae bacterium]|nr:hypothetical protein [Caldilineaceae bacterium]